MMFNKAVLLVLLLVMTLSLGLPAGQAAESKALLAIEGMV